MSHPSYAIVIDTSVAQAAGTTENLTSRNCRETLDKVQCGYQLALCKSLCIEWIKRRPEAKTRQWQLYASRYAVGWLTRMQSQRKIRWINLSHEKEEVSEDRHLIDLALHTDHRVVSRDKRARGRFSKLARQVDELRTIFWLNPDQMDVPDWLCRGAPEEDAYRLGA